MSRRVSAKSAAAEAKRVESQVRKAVGAPQLESVKSLDSFVNFRQNLGVGSDSPLSSATYGFNPISRIRTLL